MNAREREVMDAALENCLSLRNAHPYSQTEAAASSDAFLRDYGSQLLAILRAPDALIADTRAGEGVEAVKLNAWLSALLRDDCIGERMKDDIRAWQAAGRPQPAQGGQGQPEPPPTTDVGRWRAKLFDRYGSQQGAYRDLPTIAAEMLTEGEAREWKLAEAVATVRMGETQ